MDDEEYEEEDGLLLFKNNKSVYTSCTILDYRSIWSTDYILKSSLTQLAHLDARVATMLTCFVQ